MSRSVSLDDDDPISLDDEIIEKLTASTPPIYLRPKPSVRRNTTDDTRETPPVRRNTPVDSRKRPPPVRRNTMDDTRKTPEEIVKSLKAEIIKIGSKLSNLLIQLNSRKQIYETRAKTIQTLLTTITSSDRNYEKFKFELEQTDEVSRELNVYYDFINNSDHGYLLITNMHLEQLFTKSAGDINSCKKWIDKMSITIPKIEYYLINHPGLFGTGFMKKTRNRKRKKNKSKRP